MENLRSIGGESRASDLDDTKQWRLAWWKDIYHYTILGDYFWTGKGFGVNLTEDDGYVTPGDEGAPLRSPHNGHMTVLARGGVPGFALWLLAQLTYAGSLFLSYLRSRRLRESRWSGLFLFLLAYWLAFMINGSFDVVLEGPHGGIWFWTTYGVGLAALWLYRYCPNGSRRGHINGVRPRRCNGCRDRHVRNCSPHQQCNSPQTIRYSASGRTIYLRICPAALSTICQPGQRSRRWAIGARVL